MDTSSVTMVTDSDWKSWRVFVLKELERLSCNLDTVEKECSDLKSKVEYLNWRSGILGTIGGSLATIVVLLLVYWK
jgi:hypothetical protein